jgi:hypothetical protein
MRQWQFQATMAACFLLSFCRFVVAFLDASPSLMR